MSKWLDPEPAAPPHTWTDYAAGVAAIGLILLLAAVRRMARR